MKAKSKTIIQRLVCALIFSSTVAFADLTDNASKPIRIALLGPLSGQNVFLGNIEGLSAKIAIEEINKTGVRGGKKLQIIQFDTKCDLATTKERLEVLKKSGIKYMIGPVCTYIGFFDALSGYEILDMNLAITHSYNNLSPSINNGKNHTFLLRNTNEQYTEALVKFTNANYKNAKIAIFADSISVSAIIGDSKIKPLKDAGHTVVNDSSNVVSDVRDIAEQIKIIKDSKVDIIYVSSRDVSLAIKFAQEIKKADLNTIIFGDAILESTEVYNSLKEYSEIIYFASPPHYSEFAQNQGLANEIIKDKRFSIVPSLAYETHSVITMLADAFNNATSLQPKDVADYINQNTFKTAIGDVKFNKYVKNDFTTIISKWTKDGKIIEVK